MKTPQGAASQAETIEPHVIAPEVDRRNALIFASTYLFIFFAAPVVYVGVVQAALCDKLGASATVANLPASVYMFGAVASFVLAWLLPHRLERTVLVCANLVTAASMTIVCVTLFLPFSNLVRIVAVITQGLIQGFSSNVA